MKGHLKHVAGLAGVVATALTCATASYAQGETTIVAQPPPAPVNQTTVAAPGAAEAVPEYTGPNRARIGTGLVTFALSYVPSVIVASESPQPADNHLYIPVAGPWMDLAQRPDCNTSGIRCDTETTNKVLLAVDGVFQGLGVITTLAGLLSTEHEGPVTTEAQTKPSVHVSPAQMGVGGYGLAAFGNF